MTSLPVRDGRNKRLNCKRCRNTPSSRNELELNVITWRRHPIDGRQRHPSTWMQKRHGNQEMLPLKIWYGNSHWRQRKTGGAPGKGMGGDNHLMPHVKPMGACTPEGWWRGKDGSSQPNVNPETEERHRVGIMGHRCTRKIWQWDLTGKKKIQIHNIPSCPNGQTREMEKKTNQWVRIRESLKQFCPQKSNH